jgi:hypothetical protein
MVLMLIMTICHSDTGGLMQSVIILYVIVHLQQGFTNPGHQVTHAAYFVWWLPILVGPHYSSCHPSGIQNFNVAPRFSENLCTPDVKVHWLISCSGMVYLIKGHAWRNAGSMQHTSPLSVCTLPQEKEPLGLLGLASDVMCLLMSCTSQVVILCGRYGNGESWN